MKNIKIIFVLLFVLSLINVSCKNIVEDLSVGKESNKAYLMIFCNSNARTIQPSYNLEALTDFELFNNSNSKIAEAKSYQELSKLVIEVGYIPEGGNNQSFNLKAKDKDTSFSAYSQVNLHSGINNICFDLSPVKTSGKGNLGLTFTINKSLGVKGMKAGLYVVDRYRNEKSIEGFEAENLDLVIEDDVITAKYNKTSVPNGYYLFKAEFYADSGCKIFINNYENIVEVITGSTTDSVIDISELNKLYSIKYVLNGGEFIEGFSIPSVFTRLSNLELPNYINVKKEGSFFAGWYLNEDFNGNRLVTTTSLDNDIVLYAKWNSIIELTPENLSTTDLSGVNSMQKIVVSGNFSNNLNELALKIKSITSTTAEIVLDMSNMTGVTKLPDALFKNCSALESVTLGCEIKEVGYGAFSGCPLLESVYYTGTLADWIKTSFIGQYEYETGELLYGNPCYYGASLYINDEKITDRTSITIPDGIDRIGQGAFMGFKQLKSVTIPVSVTEICEYAFWDCEFLESVYYNGTISEWVTIKFDDNPCNNSDLYINGEKLTEIKENNFTSNITKIEDSAFSGCKSLTSVVIGNCIETIGDSAFSGCVSLNNVVIKEGVLEIGDSAFRNCRMLKSIEIPSSIKDIHSDAFAGASYSPGHIESVYYNGTLADWMKIHFYDSFTWNGYSLNSYYSNPCNNGCDLYINNEKLTEIKDGDIPDYITEILPGCFYCVNLTSVVIGKNIQTIGDGAFKNSKLKLLSIGNDVDVGKEAFYVNTVDIFFTGTIEQWCTKKWSMSSSYDLYIDEQKITDVSIPDSVTEFGKAFSYCKSLSKITIPSGVTEIGDRAFACCYNLETVTIPNSVIEIGYFAFENCSMLSRLDYKGSLWQWISKNYPCYMSDYLSILYLNEGKLTDCTELIVPEGVTYIPEYACNGMTSLNSVSFPAKLQFIYSNAFSGCTGLTSITFVDPNNWYVTDDKGNWNAVDVNDTVSVINLLQSGKVFGKNIN